MAHDCLSRVKVGWKSTLKVGFLQAGALPQLAEWPWGRPMLRRVPKIIAIADIEKLDSWVKRDENFQPALRRQISSKQADCVRLVRRAFVQ